MELIVAVSVMALLAGVLTPMIGNVIEESRKTRALADCKAIVDAIGSYREEVGSYPAGTQTANYNYGFGGASAGVEVLNVELIEGAKKYLSKAIGKDPWGQNYCYHIYTLSDPYMDVVVFSCGPNQTNESWDGNVWNRGAFNGDDIGAFFDVAK
jgi:type II secretory pathway pseudopilin PulG